MRYAWCSASAGDWRGFGSSAEVARSLEQTARTVQSPSEEAHFRDQVADFLACGTVTSGQGDAILAVLAEGGVR